MWELQTEYALRRMRRGQCQSQHGPYDSLEEALRHQKNARAIDETWTDTFVIVERMISEWVPSATEDGTLLPTRVRNRMEEEECH